MLTVSVPIWEIALGGKRELGQMSPADFVVILIIANAVQNAMNGGDVSLVGGLVSAATLLGMSYGLGRFGRGVPLAKVAAAILEIDGSISIIPRTGAMRRSRRRFRQFRART
ncbi:MAG: hypothetical protein WEE03_04575 [Chloroflexota bacterium]